MFWNFWRWKKRSFLEPKVDGNMMFTDYWKVLLLNFSEIGNTVFSWVKKLMEIWSLLITEKFLFWTFQRWKIRSFFEPKSLWKDDIYWLLKSSCFELFWDGKYGLFLSQKVGKYGFSCNVNTLIQGSLKCHCSYDISALKSPSKTNVLFSRESFSERFTR